MSKSDAGGGADKNHQAIDYWHLFHDLPEPHMLFEANHPLYTIVDMNKARADLTSTKRKQAIGRPLFEMFPDTSEKFKRTGINDLQQRLKKLVATGKTLRMDALRYDLLQPDGSVTIKFWRPLYQPIFAADGRVAYVLASTRDITSEMSVERRITATEARLEAALSIGKVGSWMWDVANDMVVADENLARMFGIKKRGAEYGMPLEEFVQAIHIDDRPRVTEAIAKAIKKKATFEQEYRTYTSKGKVRWVLARGKVQEQEGKLLFPGVIVDITERRDLQAQVELGRQQNLLDRQAAQILQDRNEELEAISRTKDEFVALASHQLRTPATAVKQYLGMVLQGYVGDISDVQTEMLDKAFESNERQIQIINQILNAARVDTGRLLMSPVPIDLRSLVQGIADDMASSLEQRHHSFSLTMPKLPVPVVADLGYLRMAIENVLHNASIYTPENGVITMALTRQGKLARLNITDTGVGIRKADLDKLFVKFSRIHNPLSVQAGGSGIGLYLTAEIVRLHGGTVKVDSKIHYGTTFAISLPLVQNTK